jgi:RNA polymerase sigma-70 factor (ECF subfamily)
LVKHVRAGKVPQGPPTIFFNTAELLGSACVYIKWFCAEGALECGSLLPHSKGSTGGIIGACKMEAAWEINWCHMMRMLEEAEPDVFDADAQLMLRFKKGDAKAFDLLFVRHTRAVVNFAYRFVRDRQAAEELAQEIFLRVYEGAGGYQVQAKFTTWLYRIATNVCLNEVRKPRFKALHQPLSPERPQDSDLFFRSPEGSGGPDKILERQAISQALRQALSQIPDKQRTAFILNKYQEFSYAEVAEIMKTSEKAVKSLIHRAREALAERLKPLLPGLLSQ